MPPELMVAGSKEKHQEKRKEQKLNITSLFLDISQKNLSQQYKDILVEL